MIDHVLESMNASFACLEYKSMFSPKFTKHIRTLVHFSQNTGLALGDRLCKACVPLHCV